MPHLVSLPNDVYRTIAELPYNNWWCITTQIWVVLLIWWGKFSTNQMVYPDLNSDMSSVWHYYTLHTVLSFLKHHYFQRESSGLVASLNVGFILRLFRSREVYVEQWRECDSKLLHCWFYKGFFSYLFPLSLLMTSLNPGLMTY